MCPRERGSGSSQLLLAHIPSRGRGWDRNCSRERRGWSRSALLPCPPLELAGGSDFPPAREESLAAHPTLGSSGTPGGRAGNGARLGQNEKQLQEGGAECLGGLCPANKTMAA